MRHFNVAVLGAGGVGKSALTIRYFRDDFVSSYDPTIEEIYHKTIVIDGEVCTLEVMDSAGTEQFTTISEQYITSARGFLLVFSLAQEASLQEVRKLRDQIYRIKGPQAQSRVPIVVVGTKSDLTDEREVRRSTIARLSAEWNLPFYETSAKRNHNVEATFNDLFRQMYTRYPAVTRGRDRDRGSCVIM
ncbi:rap 1A [Exidia glandulosa HHB12029]|uniref:Rap 1A n=1 Tax=Exidia glandulosa HHB12029 TaxID=1314781 RepID=A0A165Q0F7_EXIGL|nr:rap 1A [Exidia glandulosa HHB12029]